jgi:MFS family permease
MSETKIKITDSPQPESEQSILKVALTALAGTTIEWYDFFLYATAAALVFPTVFFPEDLPPLVALLASFSTFAVGFIARPVGGVIFGHYGDRLGRKRALIIALVIMGVGTTLIGCLPSYAVVGPIAPAALIFLRFVQGLAIGGQWGGAVLLITETAPKNRRGFYGSFAQIGVPAGVLIANLIFLLINASVSPDSFMAWGWRVPFLLSVILIVLALYIQLNIEDSPAFRKLQVIKEQQDTLAIQQRADTYGESIEDAKVAIVAERQPSPVLEALRAYPKTIFLAAGAFVGVQVTFYILIAFVVAYGSNEAGLGLPRSTMLTAVLIGAVVMIPALLISAHISDLRGRRGIYIAGAVLLGIWGFILFPLIDTGSFLWITVAISVGNIFLCMMYGPQAAFLAELFTTKVRYSGASLGYQLGAIIGGGFAPLIATILLAEFGGTFGISVYIAIACAITVICVLLLQETYQSNMTES